MGDDTSVRRLVEMLSAFYTEGRAVEEDLTCSLTSEFLRNIQDVLFTKEIVVFLRWRFFFDLSCEGMLLSPEMYLRYVFYACLEDARVNLHIFERFLSAFALIFRLTLEIYYRTQMNFCKLVPDIFMVFYEKELKGPFGRRNGFHRFVEYINNPSYLESECIVRSVSYFYNYKLSLYQIPKDLLEKASKIKPDSEDLPKSFNFLRDEIDLDSSSLAKKVLEITKTEFIPLQKDVNSNASLSNLIQHKTAQIAERLEMLEKIGDSDSTSEPRPSLNCDSETNGDAPAQMVDNARCNNIIEAIIKYNHSKSSSNDNTNNRIQEEANGVLDHLKITVKSLLEVLDEYDKE
ncbi:unnamed protein product [Larinioides sclopetarius]|uniref:Uncharacterized protein n=1 Tax=Larinioides sclopetarius TaxID=280406 RepID=A0AAV2BTD7_9ARAC